MLSFSNTQVKKYFCLVLNIIIMQLLILIQISNIVDYTDALYNRNYLQAPEGQHKIARLKYNHKSQAITLICISWKNTGCY